MIPESPIYILFARVMRTWTNALTATEGATGRAGDGHIFVAEYNAAPQQFRPRASPPSRPPARRLKFRAASCLGNGRSDN